MSPDRAVDRVDPPNGYDLRLRMACGSGELLEWHLPAARSLARNTGVEPTAGEASRIRAISVVIGRQGAA